MAHVRVMLLALFCLFSQTLQNPISKRAVPDFPVLTDCPKGQLLKHNHVCCKPTVCTEGYEIKSCTVNGGKDMCVQCGRGYIQLNNISSFNMVDAKCFQDPYYNAEDNYCPIEDTQKSNKNSANCALYCECKTSSCHVGSPCGCTTLSPCGINEQLNKHTKKCEPCPKYSYKNHVGCESCTFNLTLFSQGVDIPLPPQTSAPTAASVDDTTTKEHTTFAATLPVDVPQDKDISLSWMELLFIISSVVLLLVLAAVGVYCCRRSTLLRQISRKICKCPDITQTTVVTTEESSPTEENNVRVDPMPETEPLMPTTSLDAYVMSKQTSVDSGIESPGPTGNISASGPFLSDSADVQTPALGSNSAHSQGVSMYDANTRNGNSSTDSQTLEGKNISRNGARSENQTIVNEGPNGSRNGVKSENQSISVNCGLSPQNAAQLADNHSEAFVHRETYPDANVNDDNDTLNGAYGLDAEKYFGSLYLTGSSNLIDSSRLNPDFRSINTSADRENLEPKSPVSGIETLENPDPDTNSIQKTGEVLTRMDETLCKSSVNDDTSHKLSYIDDKISKNVALTSTLKCVSSAIAHRSSEIGGHATNASRSSELVGHAANTPGSPELVGHVEYREDKCDKSIDVQNSLNNDKGIRNLPVAIVRPMDHTCSSDASFMSSYQQGVLEPNAVRMCDFSSVSSVPSNEGNNDAGHSIHSLQGEMEARDGPEGRSRSRREENETSLKQVVSSENTDLKCVYRERRTVAGGETDIPPGARTASRDTCIPQRGITAGVQRVMPTGEITPGGQGAKPEAEHKELLLDEKEANLPSTKVNIRTEEFERRRVHTQAEAMNDCEVGIRQDERELKEDTITSDRDTLSGILPHSDSSVEISWYDNEPRSESVEMEFVTNLSNVTTSNLRDLVREEGDGAYSVELELFNGSDCTERVDSVETDVNDGEESVEIGLSGGNDNSVDRRAMDNGNSEETDVNDGEESVEIGLSGGNDNDY